MSHSICGISLPENLVSVTSERPCVPPAPTILCLIGILKLEWAAAAQGRALEALLNGGIKLVCLDGVSGTGAVLAKMHPHVADALRRARSRHPDIRIQGVDDPDLVAGMRRAEAAAEGDWPENEKVLTSCESLLLDLVRQRSRPDAATFLLSTHDYHSCGGRLGEYAKALLSLESRLRMTLPSDSRRILLAAERSYSFSANDIEAERKELTQRLKANLSNAVFHRPAVENIRVASRHSESSTRGHKIIQTRRGCLNLSEKDQQALATIQDFLAAGSYGGMSYTFDEMQVRQARNQAFGSNQEAERIDLQVQIMDRLFSIARLAAIDLADYPCLLACAGQSMLLHPLADRNYVENLLGSLALAEEAVEGKVCIEEQETILASLLKRWRILDSLARVKMTPSVYEELVSDLDECRLRAIVEAITRFGAPRDSASMSAAEHFDARRKEYRQFYLNARQRARSMAEAVLQTAQSQRVDKVLFLSLGFLAPTFTNNWAATDCGYVVFHPKPLSGDSLDDAQ